VALADDFRARLRELPDDWSEARFALRYADDARAARGAAVLGGINAIRRGETIYFHVDRRSAGHGPDGVARALRRIQRAGLGGELELVTSSTAAPTQAPVRASLAASWDEALAKLPSDWSDMYADVELLSSDHLERAALLLAPTNPARDGKRAALRFRCARSFGYGASPAMVRRSLERLDEAGMRGSVQILWALSDTKPWSTQGPVWYVGGKPV
jgi:hypothetical protein